MMKFNSFVVGLFAVMITACTSGPAVNTETVSGVDYSKYSTYAYLPSGDTVSSRAVFNDAVIREVNQEMQVRGYRLDTQDPDLLVLVKSMYEQESTLERRPVYTSYDYYTPGFASPTALNSYYYTGYNTIPRLAGSAIREVEYTEGTFVVDVIDASAKEIIWRGWSETPVDPMALESSVRAYVDNIYEEYPVEPQQ